MLSSPQPVGADAFDLDVLSAAVETAEALIVVTDPKGVILRFNPACERLTGWSAEEMVGRNAVDLLAPGRKAEVIERAVDHLRTGGSRRSVGRWRTRSGEERTISFTDTVLNDDQGRVRCLVATGVDITAERRAEAALVASERRHRALVEHATDVVVVLDPDSTLRYVSPSAERLLGWTPEQLEGRKGFDLVVEADQGVALMAMEETLAEPGPTTLREFRLRDRWGLPVYVEAVANNQIDDPAVAGVILHLRDIDERRRLEGDLRGAEERFRHAFAKAPTGIAVMDLAGRFVEINPALASILDRAPSELIARVEDEVTHPEDRRLDAVPLRRLLAGEVEGYQIEKRYLRPDGTTVWAMLNVSALYRPDGEPQHLLVHIEDVTARRTLTRELSHLANHDGLTGLPNRSAVHRRIDEALGRDEGAGVGVLFVDLDEFKWVNDRYGHAFGDQALAAVARRLASVVRPTDFVGRVGGDEFVIVCEPATGPTVERVAARLQERLRLPLGTAELPDLVVGASVGGVLARAGESTSEVLRRADEAMYRGKVERRESAEMARASRDSA
ncbi:MAG: PAS domain S-box protein [Acidimicrobiales bacterium]|nr:PAS domain S-box protein [Acidimicrobiales bacterium]